MKSANIFHLFARRNLDVCKEKNFLNWETGILFSFCSDLKQFFIIIHKRRFADRIFSEVIHISRLVSNAYEY